MYFKINFKGHIECFYRVNGFFELLDLWCTLLHGKFLGNNTIVIDGFYGMFCIFHLIVLVIKRYALKFTNTFVS